MITISEITKDQVIPRSLDKNLTDLVIKINKVRSAYNKPMIVSSGYRSVIYEHSKGRSGLSDHCKCQAVDIYDPDKSLAKWVHKNEELLASIPLWIENTEVTTNWVHFTTKEKSRRFFNP